MGFQVMEVCRMVEERARMPLLLLRLKEVGGLFHSILDSLLVDICKINYKGGML